MGAPGDKDARQWVKIARIQGAHGVRGWVKIMFWNGENAHRYRQLYSCGGARAFTVTIDKSTCAATKGGDGKKRYLARIDGIGDRQLAEQLAGCDLYVPRDRLPKLDPDTYYQVDLIGLRVHNRSGLIMGHVRNVSNHGAGDILEILAEDGRVVDIPFVDRWVDDVRLDPGNKEQGIIIVSTDLMETDAENGENREECREEGKG